jgi:hypothetical protein
MNVSLLLNNFIGGETSPLLAARADSPAFAAGAKRLRNFIPMMTGGVRKRPGTWLYKTAASESKTRVIEWATGLRGNNARLLLVLTPAGAAARIDVYRNGERAAQIPLDGLGEADLNEIQYAVTHEASESTLWLVHRKMPPRSITAKENAVPAAISTPQFFEMYDPGTDTAVEMAATDYTAFGEFKTEEIESATADGETVVKETFVTGAESTFVLRKDLPRDTKELKATLSIWFAIVPGYFRLNGTRQETITDPNLYVNGADFDVDLFLKRNMFPEYYGHELRYSLEYKIPDPAERRPMFNAPGKYPGAVAVYAGRLCFGGTDEYPSRIWLSRPPDSITGQNRYLEFTAGANPADAIAIEENDMEGSRVLWLAAGRRLAAGTARATWSDNGAVPAPSSFDMSIVEYTGAAQLQPRGTKEILVYAGRNGKTLRALVWQETERGAGFIDTDISRNAAHLFVSGIRDFDVTDYPYPVIWAVTGDGALASCTVDMRSGVAAWARHETDGKFESCAARREDGRDDTLFLAAKRTGSWTRDIVTLSLDELVGADYAESHYVDCGIRVGLAVPAAEVPLPEPLRRDGLQAFADGAEETVRLSKDKLAAVFRQPVKVAHIGLPYKSELSPNTPEIPANGTSAGKKRRIEKALLRVFDSFGGKCGTGEEKAVPIPYMRYGKYKLGEAPEPFTGDINLTVGGTIDPEGKFVVTHEEPVPFTLLALVERVAVLEAQG